MINQKFHFNKIRVFRTVCMVDLMATQATTGCQQRAVSLY